MGLNITLYTLRSGKSSVQGLLISEDFLNRTVPELSELKLRLGRLLELKFITINEETFELTEKGQEFLAPIDFDNTGLWDTMDLIQKSLSPLIDFNISPDISMLDFVDDIYKVQMEQNKRIIEQFEEEYRQEKLEERATKKHPKRLKLKKKSIDSAEVMFYGLRFEVIYGGKRFRGASNSSIETDEEQFVNLQYESIVRKAFIGWRDVHYEDQKLIAERAVEILSAENPNVRYEVVGI